MHFKSNKKWVRIVSEILHKTSPVTRKTLGQEDSLQGMSISNLDEKKISNDSITLYKDSSHSKSKFISAIIISQPLLKAYSAETLVVTSPVSIGSI